MRLGHVASELNAVWGDSVRRRAHLSRAVGRPSACWSRSIAVPAAVGRFAWMATRPFVTGRPQDGLCILLPWCATGRPRYM